MMKWVSSRSVRLRALTQSAAKIHEAQRQVHAAVDIKYVPNSARGVHTALGQTRVEIWSYGQWQ